MIDHPRTACPDCDDVANESCRLCRGTDVYCPICRCPADECEFHEEDDYPDDIDPNEA